MSNWTRNFEELLCLLSGLVIGFICPVCVHSAMWGGVTGGRGLW